MNFIATVSDMTAGKKERDILDLLPVNTCYKTNATIYETEFLEKDIGTMCFEELDTK